MSSIQNNSHDFLKEYRCTCGKLLFKGLLLVSIVEIKCKRCGITRLIRDLNGDLIGPTSFGLLFDIEGRIVNACKNAVPILGFSVNELLSMLVTDVSPSMTLAFYKHFWQERYAKNYYGSTRRIWHCMKNGGHVPLAAQFKFLDVSGTPYIFVLLDKAPISAEASEAEIFSDSAWFGESPNELLFVINKDGVCSSALGAIKNVLGYDPKELVGKPLHEFCPALAGGAKDSRPLCVQNAGKPYDIPHHTFTCRDGNSKSLESYFICDYDKDGFSGYRVFSWIVE